MEQTPVNTNPVLSVDKNGYVLYSNEAGNLLLNEWSVEIGEKLPSCIGEIVQKVISRNSPEKMEVKAGNRVYLVVFSPLSEQESVYISGFDISDQKEVEGKLREREKKYRNIIETSVEGIWIFNAVSETTYVNEKMAEMLGYNREEMIGRFIWDFAYEEDKSIFQIKLANRKRGIDEIYELKLIRKDGSPIWVSISAKGFFDDAGKFAGSVGMFTDITERNKVEEALRESEERFRSAFVDSAIAMALVCPDARLLKVNDAFCRLLGFEKSEMEDHTFIDFTYPDDIEPSVFIHNAVINREKPFFWLEKRYIRKDGRVIWCKVSSSPVFDSKGCPIYTVAHVQDITESKQLEEQTRQRAEELETLMDVVPVAIFIGHDHECHNITGNHMANELYEAKSGENVSANVSNLRRIFNKGTELTAEKLPMQKAAYEDIDVRNEEFDWLLPSGKRRAVIGSASPLHDAEGNVRGSIGAFIDITDRKQMEDTLKKAYDSLEAKVKERTAELEEAYISLKESEERLTEAQRIAHLGNYDNNLVSDKLYWSDELYRIFGLQPQEGMTFNKFLTYIHPDDKDYVNNAVIEAINGKHFAINYRIIRPDGQERIVHSEREAIFDKTNKPIRAKGTIQDVTEQKKSEEKIQNLANIVESSNDAIGTISPDGFILSWNKGAEQIYGYSTEEISGKPVTILAPSHLMDETIRLSERVKKGEKIRNYETIRQRKDGKTIYVSFSLSPVFDIHEKLIAISFISRDITKRKKTEEALNNIEIARKQEIHHRIKNNLQVISSLLDLQAEKFKGKKNIEDSQVLEAFRESQDRIISIALIHEELHKGGEIDTLNFSHYIEELADNLLLTYRLGNEGIGLDMSIEEDIFFDMDTAVPLGMIINELVSNSLKHAFTGRDKGEIQIKLHREENGECKIEDRNPAYLLAVSDNGIGIPEKLDIEDIDSLGLQLVTTLADQIDGELELKRDNGTEFIIKFAIAEKDNQATAPEQLVD